MCRKLTIFEMEYLQYTFEICNLVYCKYDSHSQLFCESALNYKLVATTFVLENATLAFREWLPGVPQDSF